MVETSNKLIIFDFDGVLADSLSIYYTEIVPMLKQQGFDFVKNEEEFLALFDENVVVALRKKGVSLTGLLSLWRQFEKGVEEHGIRIYNQVPEMLMGLKQQHTLAVISSNSTALVEGVLTRHQLARYFSAVFGGEKRETKTERIFWLKRKFQKEDEEVFYVGDTVGDVHEARAANVRSIAVSWGWHDRDRLTKAGPDYIVDSPEDLVDLIAAMK